MTLCNMTIEGGARAGLVAPDETTFAYIAGRPRAPKAGAFEAAVATWKLLKSDRMRFSVPKSCSKPRMCRRW